MFKMKRGSNYYDLISLMSNNSINYLGLYFWLFIYKSEILGRIYIIYYILYSVRRHNQLLILPIYVK